MTSTPSRSRAWTRMSHPAMAGPTSARRAEAGFFSCRAGATFAAEADPVVSIVLLICAFGCGRWRGLNKKPTTVASRGFLSKFNLTTTSTNGVADDNDDDCQSNCLSDVL